MKNEKLSDEERIWNSSRANRHALYRIMKNETISFWTVFCQIFVVYKFPNSLELVETSLGVLRTDEWKIKNEALSGLGKNLEMKKTAVAGLTDNSENKTVLRNIKLIIILPSSARSGLYQNKI